MQALIDVTLPVFLVIGFGYAAVWGGILSDAGIDGLMRFTQSFAIPCLLFRAISTLDLSATFDIALLGPYYLAASLSFLAGLFGARLLFGRDWEDAIAIGFCCLFANSVMLGLPITERAFGAEALASNFAIVALHSPFCYGIGITAMEIARARTNPTPGALLPKVLRAMFRNALILGIAAGFVVNLAGIDLHQSISGAVDLMVQAALPTALFGMGGVLNRYRPDGDYRVIAYVCAVSLLLHPAMVWAFGKTSGLSQEGMRSAVLTASMAPGINTYIFANIYGRAKRVAATSVLAGTALSVLTVSAWLALLGK